MRRHARSLPVMIILHRHLAHGPICVWIVLLHSIDILIVRVALIVVLGLHLDDAIDALLGLPEALSFT